MTVDMDHFPIHPPSMILYGNFDKIRLTFVRKVISAYLFFTVWKSPSWHHFGSILSLETFPPGKRSNFFDIFNLFKGLIFSKSKELAMHKRYHAERIFLTFGENSQPFKYSFIIDWKM